VVNLKTIIVSMSCDKAMGAKRAIIHQDLHLQKKCEMDSYLFE
jgi:hypothetical protein